MDQTQIDFCEQAKHMYFRATQKCLRFSAVLKLTFTKRAAKKFGSELQSIEFLPYVLTLTAWKVAKTTAPQQVIFKVQKLVDALNKSRKNKFLSKYLNSIS
jgi:hypothetical protein